MLCNEEMRKSILSRLQGYRYEHSLGVERAAIMLAEKYGEDPEKAGTAGILHDITKYLSPQEQLNLCGKYGIIPCTVEKSEPKMLHGKTAAAIARAEYHMPEDICDAMIEQFTTMSFDGLTGTGMHWDENGMISKAPAAVVIENGVYVPMG